MTEEDVLSEVGSRLSQLSLSNTTAARQIGVSPDTLRRHLSGDYVRSDSLAKYRRWLSGGPTPRSGLRESSPAAPGRSQHCQGGVAARRNGSRPTAPSRRVVDLFSGCGGLALGFESVAEGGTFRTALAIDVEEPMVRVFNANHPTDTGHPVAQCVDLSDFINETEVRALYLSHLSEVEDDQDLRAELASTPLGALSGVVSRIRAIDGEFQAALADYRGRSEFAAAYGKLDSKVLGQTSVVGFHDALRIPKPSSGGQESLQPMVWAGKVVGGVQHRLGAALTRRQKAITDRIKPELESRWETQLASLLAKAKGSGRGQLRGSAGRIAAFTRFVSRTPTIKRLWMNWRAERDGLRFAYFQSPSVARHLANIYRDARRVSVVLGGPPCQGFSRIGRGKLRSLRQDRVHAYYDAEAGDTRNRLFEKYVLFVSALAPEAFLFENVRHFQTRVEAPDGSFLATEVLREALHDLSESGLHYQLASRTVLASEHGVPQTRERYFMVGLRSDIASRYKRTTAGSPTDWVLDLPRTEPVTLRAALEGLPPPFLVGGQGDGSELGRLAELANGRGRPQHCGSPDVACQYGRWIRVPPGETDPTLLVDSHVARNHRRDDQEFFALLGPGRCWADYRADGSATLQELQRALESLESLLEDRACASNDLPMTVQEVRELRSMVDGSLSIRLLLERIPPLEGEVEHHLLSPSYLRRQSGKHGDWLARMAQDEPAKTMVAHMSKDTYAFVHPTEPRTLSVREAARIQSFPDWYSFSSLGLVDAFRVIGNAVPPFLSWQMGTRIAQLLGSHSLDDGAPQRRSRA